MNRSTANPRYANGARRRRARTHLLTTQTHCGICGHPVDKTIPTPHPDSPEIDEITPISKGGSPYQLTNLQLTHRRCNRAKSDKTTTDDNAARTFVTTRQW